MAATKPVAKKAAKPTPVVAKKAAATVSKPAAKPAVKAKAATPAPESKKAVPAKKEVAKPAPKAPAPKKAAVAAPAKSAEKVVASKPAATVASKPKAAAPTPQKTITPIKELKVEKTPPPPTIMPTKKKEETKPSKIVVPKTTAKTAVKYEPDFMKSVLDTTTQPEEPIAPTMRYSDNDLSEFRDLINRKLDAAKKELSYLQGLITRKDEMGGDNDDARYMTMEDGSLSMEREQLSQMASRQITFVDHLEKALMRIESKTYGVCRVTGKLIDKARLRAVPHATLSMEAKMGKVRQP
jgi:RNA polymerase-binding transcription factor DksA